MKNESWNPKGKFYRKGVRYERKLVNEYRAKGHVAFRSAGSKSPIDLISIDAKNKIIQLIQAKAGKALSETGRERLRSVMSYLNGTYEVKFKVV